MKSRPCTSLSNTHHAGYELRCVGRDEGYGVLLGFFVVAVDFNLPPFPRLPVEFRGGTFRAGGEPFFRGLVLLEELRAVEEFEGELGYVETEEVWIVGRCGANGKQEEAGKKTRKRLEFVGGCVSRVHSLLF